MTIPTSAPGPPSSGPFIDGGGNGSETAFHLSLSQPHDHRDLVQVVAFNTYGDRCATGSLDGTVRVFNRHQDAIWRSCDKWNAHAGEVIELQWLPVTVYPNLLASLGGDGRFKLWAEDPSAPPGSRFYNGRASGVRATFDLRAPGRPSYRPMYRSFSLLHLDDTRATYLALLASDGGLTVRESEDPEHLAFGGVVDEFSILGPAGRPARGEELSFRVRFDPSPEPCYAALRAGLSQESLGLVTASMASVRLYRSQDVETVAFGTARTSRRFFCALELVDFRGLVRDVAWAPGNVRGYDIIATACQDGLVRVFRVDTPARDDDAANGIPHAWSVAALPRRPARHDRSPAPSSQSSLSASLAKSGAAADGGDRSIAAGRHAGLVAHTVREIARLDAHGSPVWRVGFDDDGQILASAGDDGRLMCYRQTSDGSWAKSSELAVMRDRMVAPS